ncbi:peptidase U32 family protein [Bacillaceae bacterium]
MARMPELQITAASVEEVRRVLDAGADAVHIGGETYGLRVPGSFGLEEIAEAVALAHARGAKVYVSVNALFHNEALAGLPEYLRQLEERNVDAIIFGDPAVLMAAKETGVRLKLHWDSETTTTNFGTINYWAKKGVARAILARELNLEEVLEIKAKANAEIEVQVHGMTCIFHSKRSLVTNYLKHLGKELQAEDLSHLRGLFLKEQKRNDLRYPIFEDVHGTHIMSGEDVCMIEHLAPLVAAGIDSVKIEGIMKPPEYNEAVVRIYREALALCAQDEKAYAERAPRWREEIERLQPKERPLGTGFYFKEQVY